MIVIFFAVASIQFLFSMMDGFMGRMLNDMFENYGHIVLNLKGYRAKQKLYPLDYTIPDSEKVISELKEIGGIASIRTEIMFGAMAEGKEYSFPVICQGISIGDDPTSRKYRNHLIDGEMITPDGDGVLIGDELSKSLGRKTGDTLMLLIQDYYGSPNPAEFTVRGVINTHIKAERSSMVILPQKVSAEILNLPGDTISIKIDLKDRNMISRTYTENTSSDSTEGKKSDKQPVPVYTDYEKKFRAVAKRHGLELTTYLDKFKGMLGMLKYADIFMIVTYILFIVIAAVTIINTVLTSVFERFRDFGTIRAIGLGKTGLFSVIILEAALNSLAAVLLVNAVSIPALLYLNIHGFDFGEAGEVMQGMSSVVFFSVHPKIFINGSLVGILAGIVSAIYPAAIAVRKHVVEALRYV